MKETGNAVRWQKVHVFISSTFNDMHAERDYLVKKVFPELQEWCERRKLRLVDIDLRWGVTEQDATHNRNVVKVCLERIDDCRPFFLCFLGQRRGWVPREDDMSPDTLARFPELRRYVNNASITELEILHALIDPLHRGIKYDPRKSDEKFEKALHSFFYFRDDSYLDKLPAVPRQLRETYTNEGIEDPAERERHDLELGKWRERFEDTCCHYTADWNEKAATPEIRLPLSTPSTDPVQISRWRAQWAGAGIEVAGTNIDEDPALAAKARDFNESLCRGRLGNFVSVGEELKEVILRNLKKAIEARYPDHVDHLEESELQSELDQQEEFQYANSEGFIEREGDFDELDRYLEDDSRQLFILTASAGMGKSMLLANWIGRWKERPGSGQTLHFRFVGQSDRSTSLPDLLRSLLLELQQVAGKVPSTIVETVKDPSGNEITREVPFLLPEDPIQLQALWQEHLRQLERHGKTVIVIDAVNELDTGLNDFSWLPLQGLPAHLKLVVSIREDAGGARELLDRLAAEGRHCRLARVKPFADLNDRRLLVSAYLGNYLKEIDARHMEEIICLKGAENPLFLKIVLSELRVFGSFMNLADKIRSDFGDNPGSAFDAVLSRLECDPAYSAILPGDAVPLLFGLLAHSRQGLSAEELAGMLSQSLGLGETEAANTLALETLYLFVRQVRPFLSRREGRYGFFYESFKEAVLERYLKKSSLDSLPRRSAHEWQQILARYFSLLPLWVDGERNRPHHRKVAELPYHLTMGGMWIEVNKTLSDLRFVEAKCAAGLVYELQSDYRLALDNLPERESEIRAERERQEAIMRWAVELAACARSRREHPTASVGDAEAAEEGPCLPEPPPTCRMWDELQIEAESRRMVESPTPLDVLSTFAAFVRGECHALLEYGRSPGFVLQHAWSCAPVGPVHGEAGALLSACRSPVLLRRWIEAAAPSPLPAVLNTLEGHRDHVHAVAMTPDGRLAVSGGADRTVRVWELSSGRCLHILRGHGDHVQSVALAPDGSLAVSGSSDQEIRVWDLTGGRCLMTLEGAPSESLALTADGRVAVSGGTAIHVWDLQRDQCLKKIMDRGFTVNCVAVTPDGRRAVSGCSDQAVRVWDLFSGACLHSLKGHREEIQSVAVTPDGQLAVSGSSDYTVRLWDLTRGRCLRTLAGHDGSVKGVAITPDGKVAVSAGSKDNTVRVWNLQDGRCLRVLEGHDREVWSTAVSADGRRASSGSYDGTVRIWDLERGQCGNSGKASKRRTDQGDPTTAMHSPKMTFIGSSDRVECATFAPDGRCAVSGGWDGILRVWDLAGSRRLHALAGHRGVIASVAMAPDGQRAVSGSWDETLRVWDLATGRCLHTLEGHSDKVWSVAMTSDGRCAVSGSFDQTLRIWDLVSGKCVRSLQGHLGEVLSVVLTPDGHRAVSASSDRTLRVWNLKNGQCLRVLQSHKDEIWSVAVTPDGRHAVSGGGDKTVRIWDLTNGLCLHTMKGHDETIWKVALTPDGTQAVSASFDRTLRVWDLSSGLCLHTLAGHRDFVNCLSVTPDGRYAVSGSLDKSIRLWDLRRAECLSLFSAPMEVTAISLAGSGTCICAGTHGGTVLFLEPGGGMSPQAWSDDTRDGHAGPTRKPWWKLW